MSTHDVALGRFTHSGVSEPGSTLPIEIAFLAAHGFTHDVLRRAADESLEQGVSADIGMIAGGLISEVVFYRSVARTLGVPFSVARIETRTGAFTRQALAAGMAMLATGGFVAAPRGPALAALLEQGAAGAAPDARLTITTPSHLAQAIFAAASKDIAWQASFSLQDRGRHLSAAHDAHCMPRNLLHVIAAGALVASVVLPYGPAASVSAVWSFLLLLSLIMRLMICGASQTPRPPPRPRLKQRDLPVYTVLVPLSQEATIVPKLIAALDALAYPAAKLQILLIVEDDDSETQVALANAGLGPCYEIIVAPPGHPRTKPRALNVGLIRARGTLLTVFDAEDIPEPRQLRLAAERFAGAPDTLACLQAKLAIFNIADSWLARLFAIEYAMLFDVMNIGQAACGIPLPLGGTSNHFRVDALRTVGGWDAWNVTEDADLGFRLARFGYSVDVLASTTFEEAPDTLNAWFLQRRRWCKGWLQTELTLARRPVKLLRDMGLYRALSTGGVLITLVVSPLIWPLCLLVFVYDLVAFGAPAPLGTAAILHATLWVAVIVAACSLTGWSAILALQRRGLLPLWHVLPLLPVYNLLISAAAWAAVYDLIKHPYYWNKTAHGVTLAPARRPK